MDPIRRNILATSAAVSVLAAAPRVIANQSGQGGATTSFYEKGNLRIRYQEIGSGFPLLVTPGGGLNSRISNWPTAVFTAIKVFRTTSAASRWTSATPAAANPLARSQSTTRGALSPMTSWG